MTSFAWATSRSESFDGEAPAAVTLFVFALAAFIMSQPAPSATTPASLGLFALLAGGYLILGVHVVRTWLCRHLSPLARVLVGPVVLWTACVTYAAAAGLHAEWRALVFGIFLAAPALLLASAANEAQVRVPWRELAAA